MKIIRILILAPIVVYILTLAILLQLRLVLGDSFPWLAVVNMFSPFLFLPLPLFFILTLLMRSWVLLVWQSILILVAVVWFGPLFIPKEAIQPRSEPLSVVSFNINPRNRDLDTMTSWLQEQQADIIFLQDLGNQWRNSEINDLIEQFPHSEISTVGQGKLILSRFPLRDAELIDLNADGVPDTQRTLVDVEGQTIALYNVHLENPSVRLVDIGDTSLVDLFSAYDDSIRNDQISKLLIRLSTEVHPHIVAGDFNTSSFSAKYYEISRSLGDAFEARGSGFGFTWSAIGRIPLLLRIDYVWYSRHFRAVFADVGPSLGSDHLPVRAELELISVPVR